MLHHHEFGRPKGYPTLAIHGVGGHGARWRAFAERLPSLRVFAPDLRGHGQSPPDPPWTLERHAADLLELMDSLRCNEFAVIGHSFGGAIAVHLARLARARVTKLVLLDPAIGIGADVALARSGHAQRVFANREQARQAQRYDWPGVDEHAVDTELDQHLTKTADGLRFRYLAAAATTAWSEMCRPPTLPPTDTPTLLVPANRSDYACAAFITGCQLFLGDNFQLSTMDTGHMAFLERPDELAELITEFVLGERHG